MTKDLLQIVIKDLPQEFNLDQLFERLVFIEEVEAARKEIKDGKGIPQDEMKKRIEEWKRK